jgi:hypothetical protein
VPTFNEILEAEKRTLTRTKRADPGTGETFGLAFSGGGIRSATFNLGVLQGLAQAGLLAKAKYLSTVSGGGYIGGWLCSWIKRAPGGMSEVQDKLGNYERHRDVHGDVAEPKQINFLRDYSNYLTPRKGLFGADTWAAIATYLRNVLLNQVILISFLGAIVLIPWFLGAAMHTISELKVIKEHGAVAATVILAAASLLLVWAVAWSSAETARCSLPAKTKPGEPMDATERETEQGASQKRITWFVALPLFVSGSITVLAFWLWPTLAKQSLIPWVLAGSAVYFVAHLIGLIVRIAVIRAAGQKDHQLTRPQVVGIPLTALLAGTVGGLLVKVCNVAVSHWTTMGSRWGGPMHARPWHAIAYGPPLLVMAFLLVGCLHIGLLKLLIGPEEQEWWGRLGGLLLLAVVGWTGVFGLAIFAPYMVLLLAPWVKTKIGIVLGWMGSTAFGLLFGKDGKTSGQSDDNPKLARAVAISPYIFILGLLILLSVGAHRLAIWPASPERYWASADNVSLRRLLPSILALGGLAVLMALRIDINIFSMNLLYRNRLVRCYLGASRPHGERRANRFTGFDADDDLFLTDFSEYTSSEPVYDGPYPILCAALNVTHGGRLAWQERKAESFVFTPGYCGYEFPEMKFESDKAPRDGFRPTSTYAYPVDSHSALHIARGGVHLGTAVSISGAAASPNMGYHTSPPLAFLMTVFDVRLGWWLPNSRYTNDELPIKKPEGGPPSSLLYLLNELMASTTDQAKYVYISDGGHFENLAIYELVRRRCRYIIACDADADNGMTFGDLGNAIRKCRSDFGVEITIDPTPVRLLRPDGFAQAHGVAGAVRYPHLSDDQPDFVGKILYIKPTITPNTPRDVLAYRDGHLGFPDQSTADQWFDESQFESYRRLGLHSFQSLAGISGCGPLSKPLTVRELFDIVKAQASV